MAVKIGGISLEGYQMNRRNFLSVLASSVGALLIGGRGAAARSAELPAAPAPVSLCRCPIAGLQHHKGLAILPTLREGQSLILQREPDNPYDQLAIVVRTASGRKLGYLPRRLNEIPAGLMDEGHRLAAVIVSVDRDAPLWEIVGIEVRLAV